MRRVGGFSTAENLAEMNAAQQRAEELIGGDLGVFDDQPALAGQVAEIAGQGQPGRAGTGVIDRPAQCRKAIGFPGHHPIERQNMGRQEVFEKALTQICAKFVQAWRSPRRRSAPRPRTARIAGR